MEPPLNWGHLHKQDTFANQNTSFVYLITPEMRTPHYSGHFTLSQVPLYILWYRCRSFLLNRKCPQNGWQVFDVCLSGLLISPISIATITHNYSNYHILLMILALLQSSHIKLYLLLTGRSRGKKAWLNSTWNPSCLKRGHLNKQDTLLHSPKCNTSLYSGHSLLSRIQLIRPRFNYLLVPLPWELDYGTATIWLVY